MAYFDEKDQDERVAEIMNRVKNAKSGENNEEVKNTPNASRRKNMTEQELVSEILNRKDTLYNPQKALDNIVLNTRCKSCGRTLSSLERITFENKCYDCMKGENKNARDKFVKKYILIAFAFIVALVFGGYCANAGSTAWLIVGVVISALVTSVSLGYVFYTNMDKILPNSKPKVQVRIVFILALAVAFLIAILTYISKSWILYVVLMIAVGCYLVYLAYSELQRIKEKENRLQVFERKARNKEYVESITEDIEKRTLNNENESVKSISIENKDFVPLEMRNDKTDDNDNQLPPETDEISDDVIEKSDKDFNALEELDLPFKDKNEEAEEDEEVVKKSDDDVVKKIPKIEENSSMDIDNSNTSEIIKKSDDNLDVFATEEFEDSGDFSI